MDITLQMMDAAKEYHLQTGKTKMDFSVPESIKLDIEISVDNPRANWQYRQAIANEVIKKVIELS